MVSVISVEGVGFSYEDGRSVLADVNFSVATGERVALIGANGAGKSTLLRLLVGLRSLSMGQVTVFGTKVSHSSLAEIRQRCGFLFQNADDQILLPRVVDDVGFSLKARGLSQAEVRRKVEGVLEMVGCGHLIERMAHRLSGGEKRLVSLAGVLICEPDILLLDEPTANLDPRARREFVSLLHTLPQTCIVVTHDLQLAQLLCSRVVLLSGGRVCADGSVDEILRDESLLISAGL